MLKTFFEKIMKSDRKIVAWLGRWLHRYRQFLLGLVVGVMLTFLTGAAWNAALDWWFSRGWEERMASNLDAPPFPKNVTVEYDWTVQTLEGEEFHLTDVQGQVVFLNFWATWCPPCIAEMPSIQRLYDRLNDAGVAFLCISDEERETVQKFITEKGYTFPVYTMQEERPKDFLGRGIPTTFLLNREGKIAFRHVGSAKWDDELAVDFIKGLL
ncbi:MAG: TlpA family protein disulfide reductase [bacterium]|nr:TlpA family protein disulfide reductase [bacterium]